MSVHIVSVGGSTDAACCPSHGTAFLALPGRHRQALPRLPSSSRHCLRPTFLKGIERCKSRPQAASKAVIVLTVLAVLWLAKRAPACLTRTALLKTNQQLLSECPGLVGPCPVGAEAVFVLASWISWHMLEMRLATGTMSSSVKTCAAYGAHLACVASNSDRCFTAGIWWEAGITDQTTSVHVPRSAGASQAVHVSRTQRQSVL